MFNRSELVLVPFLLPGHEDQAGCSRKRPLPPPADDQQPPRKQRRKFMQTPPCFSWSFASQNVYRLLQNSRWVCCCDSFVQELYKPVCPLSTFRGFQWWRTAAGGDNGGHVDMKLDWAVFYYWTYKAIFVLTIIANALILSFGILFCTTTEIVGWSIWGNLSAYETTLIYLHASKMSKQNLTS